MGSGVVEKLDGGLLWYFMYLFFMVLSKQLRDGGFVWFTFYKVAFWSVKYSFGFIFIYLSSFFLLLAGLG